ncbi:MAG: sigma-54 dependent transcriptional regulator [Thermoanaerobaculia bacterium]
MTPKLLIVDDEAAFTMPLAAYLMRVGFTTSVADRLTSARAALAGGRFDGILLDLNLPDGNGLDWISEVREESPDIAIVVITGNEELRVAVEAMRRGADHYVTKPVDLPDLELFLRKSLEVGMLRKRKAVTQRLAKPADVFIGSSAAARAVFYLAEVAAESDTSVIITGETGTGKGVLSRLIHQRSARRSMPFVEVNCSTLRGDLLSSELFGHARGAFTSAVESRQGLLDAADGGTLFLDEIGDMDPGVQAQFLKAIEEKRYRRMGEIQTRESDFRLLAATNRNLAMEASAGRFRHDLLYRINVLTIRMPSLREMVEDLPELVRFLLRGLGSRADSIDPAAFQVLQRYEWPGNVRELRNVLERALLLSRGESITTEHLPGLEAPASRGSDAQPASATAETDALREVLLRVGGDKVRAARELGISRATLYRRVKALSARK